MRALVVEDDPKMRALLERALREAEWEVDATGDAEAALALARRRAHDVVVLDVMLPGRDGFDVLGELRRRGTAAPVLMLTARSSVEDRVRGLDLGADDYLPKPFDLQELLARLRALARRPGPERAGILRLADLELDPSARVATRAGKVLPLTAKELQLLEYLLRNKGVVVSRTRVLDAVWGLDADAGSNLVAVYVKYLRRKVDDPHERKLIHTVRGVGYVMREETA